MNYLFKFWSFSNILYILFYSFCDCYEAVIGPLPVVENFNLNKDELFEVSFGVNLMSTNKNPKGVPLEHLIACITGVEVAKTSFCIKKVQWLENRNQSDPQGILIYYENAKIYVLFK